MFRSSVVPFVLMLGLTASGVSAQTISLSGKVSSTSGKALTGAIVTLANQNMKDTTDAAGTYSLSGSTAIANRGRVLPSSEKISFANGIVILRLTQPFAVGIDVFDIKGNMLERAFDRTASAGDYRFDMTDRSFATNVILVRVSVGRNSSVFRYAPMENGKRTVAATVTAGSNGREGLAKSLATVDSLKVTASGYVSKAVAISSYQGAVNISLDSIALAKFSFFVTSLLGLQQLSGSTNGFGGDFRFHHTGAGAGLLGADSICQCLAENSMPGSKVKTWRAFLSVTADASGKQVNAIDRIGTGPWYDRLGRLVSNNVSDLLHPRPSADVAIKNDLPNEYGVPNHQPDPNQAAVDNHQFVTGSDTLGRLWSSNATCQDWTSNTDTTSKPRSGLSWPREGMGGVTGGGGMGGGWAEWNGDMTNWISVWNLWGCIAGLDLNDADARGKQGVYTIGNGGGYGGFYCFALNP